MAACLAVDDHYGDGQRHYDGKQDHHHYNCNVEECAGLWLKYHQYAHKMGPIQ